MSLMSPEQGDLSLLNAPLAQELLHSAIPARLAYVWPDGTPRVIPIWFQWTGAEVVLCSPASSPKMKALSQGTKVALTIDYEAWPARVLLIRGTTDIRIVDGEVPEYPEITRRYLGEEGSLAWRAQYAHMFPQPVRIAIKPDWAALVNVETRFPSAIAKAIAGMQ